MVGIPPNHWLNHCRSRIEALTSAGVPASVSSNSAIGRRFIIRNCRHSLRGRVSTPRYKPLEGPKEPCYSRLHFGEFFFEKLLVVEVSVIAVQGEQFVVGAEFDDSASVKHSNTVGVAHRR